MKTTKNTPLSKHFFCLCALFLLSNAVITLPSKNATQFTFLGFLICFIFSFILCFIILQIKSVKFLLYLSVLPALYCLFDAFLDFIFFVSQNLLPETQHFFIILPFVLTIIFFAKNKKSAILKFSLLAFVFCVIAIIFFFLATLKDFTFSNIFIKTLPKAKQLLNQSFPYIKKVVLPSLLLPIFAKLENQQKKTALSGLTRGYILIGICLLNSLLLFGNEFSGRLDFPYAQAISTVTFGNLFTRMDGFSYFIYLVCCLIKITVCIDIIKTALERERFLSY